MLFISPVRVKHTWYLISDLLAWEEDYIYNDEGIDEGNWSWFIGQL
jgi:hypothetical protein